MTNSFASNDLPRSIIIHIGLPKTGSSFLQKNFFPAIENVYYFQRRYGVPKFSHWVRGQVSHYLRLTIVGTPSKRFEVWLLFLKLLAKKKPVLISDESLSAGGSSFFEMYGDSVEDFVRKISDFSQRIGSVQLKIILGQRDVAEWIASSYAQRARRFPNPGQSDFEERIRFILTADPEPPILSWLSRSNLVAKFTELLGKDNLFIYDLKDLSLNPDAILNDLRNFIAHDSAYSNTAYQHYLALEKENVKKVGNSSWKLRGNSKVIELSPEFSSALRNRFDT